VDPNRVGSTPFCRIRVSIGINSKQIIKLINYSILFYRKFQYVVQIYDTFDTDEKQKMLRLNSKKIIFSTCS
jgi:hypothetical protein